MRRLRNLTLALVALTVWGAPIRAQESEEMVADEGAIHVMLLRQKSVRDDLKLTEDESRKILEHNVKQWKKAQEIHKLPADQRRPKYDALALENERFLDEILEPSERKRLDEISLQVAGLLLATSHKNAARLALTEQQKEQLTRHQKEAHHEMVSALRQKTDEGRAEKMKELNATSRRRLLDVLTDSQEATWKEMIGAPFEGKFRYDSDDEK